MAYAQVTLANLQTLLAQKWEQSPFWTSTDATQAFNDTLRIWNILTGYFHARDTKLTVAGQSLYDMPTTNFLMYRIAAYFNSKPIKINSLYSMDYGQPGWEVQSVNDGGSVPTEIKAIVPVGLTKFKVWPRDVAPAGNTITIDGVRAAPTLVNPGDFIQLGQEELNVILGHSLHLAAFKVSGPLWVGTFKFYQQFIQAATDRNGRLKASSWYREYAGLDRLNNQKPTAVEADLSAVMPKEQ